VFSVSPQPKPRIKRPSDRWSRVKRGLRQHHRMTPDRVTTLVTIGTFLVITATAPARASASSWRCGEGDLVARSVNSGVQIESGQKLTI